MTVAGLEQVLRDAGGCVTTITPLPVALQSQHGHGTPGACLLRRWRLRPSQAGAGEPSRSPRFSSDTPALRDRVGRGPGGSKGWGSE